MSDVKTAYGSSNVGITLTFTSLGNGNARESDVVDNGTNKYLDALVQIQVTAGSSGVSATGVVNVYAYATADGGTTYGDTCTGSDAAVTLTSPNNLKPLGTLNVVAVNGVYKSDPMSVAAAFGGILPAKWGIVVENKSGAALAASGHASFYQGVYGTVA